MNRGVIDAQYVAAEMKIPGSKLAILSRRSDRIASARTRHRGFHPNGAHRVLALSPQVFSVFRSSPENDAHVLAMTNVSDRLIRLSIPLEGLPVQTLRWRDLISDPKSSEERHPRNHVPAL